MKKNAASLVIGVFNRTGDFAENKDVARQIRIEQVIPTLSSGKSIVIDFTNVSFTTQSFVHAMLSEALRQFGQKALDSMEFKACAPAVKSVIQTVVEYSLAARETVSS